MSMIKRKVKGHSTGQMAESMKEDGKMENNTEQEPILLQVEKQRKDSGKTAKDCIGFQTMEKNKQENEKYKI